MNGDTATRREWLRQSSGILGLGAGLPLAGCAGAPEQAAAPPKLKIVAVGGHVDDPQAGCGGTMALYANLGHDVVALSLTHGDSESIARGLQMPEKELAARRSADALKSCEILKTRMVFLDQVNGHTEVHPAAYEKFAQALHGERPDVVFTHWPVDTHRDHRSASLLTYDAWVRGGRKFALYFYEVEAGLQTQCFTPNCYVDVSAVEQQKREACFANAITIKSWWPMHEAMLHFRGMEAGCKAAEAFVHHVQSPSAVFPGKP